MHKPMSSSTRAWVSAVAVPVVSFALAATAWFGGHLPNDQLAAGGGNHGVVATRTETRSLAIIWGGGRRPI